MKQLILQQTPRPRDLNNVGIVFGGWTLSFLDEAAATFAVEEIGGKLVTHRINNLIFLKPIFSGDLVSAYVTSFEIRESEVEAHVEIFAKRIHNSTTNEIVKVLEADVTGVAIDDSGKRRTI